MIILVGLVLATGCQSASRLPPAVATTAVSPPDDFRLPPQSLVSSTGVTVEVSHFTYGADCLRLELEATDPSTPNGASVAETDISTFSEVSIYLPGSPTPLREPTGVGWGNKELADGRWTSGQNMRFPFNPDTLEGTRDPQHRRLPIPLTVQIIMHDALAFEGPLLFHLQAMPTVPCEFSPSPTPPTADAQVFDVWTQVPLPAPGRHDWATLWTIDDRFVWCYYGRFLTSSNGLDWEDDPGFDRSRSCQEHQEDTGIWVADLPNGQPFDVEALPPEMRRSPVRNYGPYGAVVGNRYLLLVFDDNRNATLWIRDH